jgi:hypothetical protein
MGTSHHFEPHSFLHQALTFFKVSFGIAPESPVLTYPLYTGECPLAKKKNYAKTRNIHKLCHQKRRHGQNEFHHLDVVCVANLQASRIRLCQVNASNSMGVLRTACVKNVGLVHLQRKVRPTHVQAVLKNYRWLTNVTWKQSQTQTQRLLNCDGLCIIVQKNESRPI